MSEETTTLAEDRTQEANSLLIATRDLAIKAEDIQKYLLSVVKAIDILRVAGSLRQEGAYFSYLEIGSFIAELTSPKAFYAGRFLDTDNTEISVFRFCLYKNETTTIPTWFGRRKEKVEKVLIFRKYYFWREIKDKSIQEIYPFSSGDFSNYLQSFDRLFDISSFVALVRELIQQLDISISL